MSASSATTRANMKASRSGSPQADDLSFDDGTSKAVKTILKSRKCWRNMKGKEEAVWPPELEAALIEGLEKYRPAEAKSTRVLGRFPMRNKFVADHIFETTGQRRTPKQVGSRIQQLRDTSSGKHILKAISDRHYQMMHPKKATSEEQQAGPSRRSSPAAPLPPMTAAMPPLSHVYITTLSPRTPWPSRLSPVPLSGLQSQEPRPLHAFDSSVTFTSPGQTPCQSVYQVFKGPVLVHQEYAPVSISPVPLPGAGTSIPLYMYSTSLVPQYWSYLCEIDDLSEYSIYQEVVRMPLPTVMPSGSPVILSVLYHLVTSNVNNFSTSASTPPLSPRSLCGESEFDFSTLSSASSPSPLLGSNTLATPPMSGCIDNTSIPELVFNFEDETSSLPLSPLEFSTLDDRSWSYPPSSLPLSDSLSSSSSSCDSYDPYLDAAAALFDVFVYPQ